MTFRVWSLITTLYMVGIAVGLNQTRKTSTSPLLNLYIIMLILCTALLFLTSLAAAPVYWIIYAVTVFIVHKVSTGQGTPAPE